VVKIGTPRGAGAGRGRVRETRLCPNGGFQRTHHEAVDDEVVVAEPPEIDILDDRGVCRFGKLQARCEGREHTEDGEVEYLHTRSERGSSATAGAWTCRWTNRPNWLPKAHA